MNNFHDFLFKNMQKFSALNNLKVCIQCLNFKKNIKARKELKTGLFLKAFILIQYMYGKALVYVW